ncbi:MAG TPA: zf-TFIIB domain-containing protein [Casimicrobiaceae bacterium]|nr:zf-TFIIB domain-containing protein [Casimicrobiaceae bacterium]
MNCPGCGAPMQTLDFERLLVGRVALDFCFPCQLVWFDEHESTQLTPGGVIEVFKAFDAHRAPKRNPLPELLDCPRCNSRLALTHDLQRTTHFTYFRCEWGHGRLTPFVQFLLEKNFVRPLSGSELATLKDRVRTVQCSNCGAPIDLQRDTACPYCRSPLAILDPEAVNKALRELSTAEIQRKTIDVDRLADALTMRAPGIGGLDRGATAAIDAGLAGDLVAAGVTIVAALLS